MSLARKDLEPLQDVLDNLRLPSGLNQAVTVNLYNRPKFEGHFYSNPINIISGDSSLTQGDLGTMSRGSHRQSPHHDKAAVMTPPPSEFTADTDRQSLTAPQEAPPGYRTRKYDWFRPGRYFKIWAREGDDVDIEIHEKEFILLDTKNIEGPGLLVRSHTREECEGHGGSFNRTHVLLKNHQHSASSFTAGSTSGRKVVFLDEGDDDVAENTFIELEHAYNIPFVKYKCIDYGVLTTSSLKTLRRYYVAWLTYHWDLE